MAYDSEMQKAFAMLLGMVSGPEDTVDTMERNEQIRVINACEVPKHMNPDRESFEKLGFQFEMIAGDDVLCKATLPCGWKMKVTDTYHTSIFDENDVERASFFYKGVFYNRTGHMILYKRYIVQTISVGNTNEIQLVVFDRKNNTVVEVFGTFSDMWSDAYNCTSEKAYRWLEQNFPDWKDPLAYWD